VGRVIFCSAECVHNVMVPRRWFYEHVGLSCNAP
jgi:hypothetical protein